MNDVAAGATGIDAEPDFAGRAVNESAVPEQEMQPTRSCPMNTSARKPLPVLTPPIAGFLMPAEIEIENVEFDRLAGWNSNQAARMVTPKPLDLVGIGAGVLKAVPRCR